MRIGAYKWRQIVCEEEVSVCDSAVVHSAFGSRKPDRLRERQAAGNVR